MQMLNIAPKIFRYSHLSAGYTGELIKESSLNSQYYGTFFNEIRKNPEILSRIIIFPQRIPRAGFFEELGSLESAHFKIALKNTLSTMTDKLKSEDNIRCFINYANILLRYGCFEEIINHFPDRYTGPYSLEVKLLKEATIREICLSHENKFSLNGLFKLVEKYLHDKKTTDREKIKLLNTIIVNFFRHKHCSSNKLIHFSSQHLAKLLKSLKSKDIFDLLHLSVAYRGLAMDDEFETKTRTTYLDKAEKIARQMVGSSNIENIVALENLSTCLQTLSKWNFHLKNLRKAENNLLEIIQIDPFDSTGHSELGFFYLKIANYDLAASHFKKALELGPPGVGMNAYYYAKCLEYLGKKEEAIHYLHESAKLDKNAISPWLDLMDHYADKTKLNQMKTIASHILSTPILMEQLQADEIITLQNCIK